MERTSKAVFCEMSELFKTMEVDGVKWVETDINSAAARLRKATLTLDKLCKEFRKLSVAETKK